MNSSSHDIQEAGGDDKCLRAAKALQGMPEASWLIELKVWSGQVSKADNASHVWQVEKLQGVVEAD